jgi:hypothetical protein
MRQHRRHAESGEPQYQVPQHRHHLAVAAGQQQLGQSRPSGAASQRESTPASNPTPAAPACRSAAMVTKLTTTTDTSITAATPGP